MPILHPQIGLRPPSTLMKIVNIASAANALPRHLWQWLRTCKQKFRDTRAEQHAYLIANLPPVTNEDNQQLPLELDAMYSELRRLARSQMRRERADHTLSATGLVHEAYLKLAASHAQWSDKNHFLGIAARAMRQILVNHALAHKAEKRGGEWLKLTLTSATPEIEAQSAQPSSTDDARDVIGLDVALKQLDAIDPRQARLVELRYFAGLTIEETAEAMSLSPATVKREWALARLYLKRVMRA